MKIPTQWQENLTQSYQLEPYINCVRVCLINDDSWQRNAQQMKFVKLCRRVVLPQHLSQVDSIPLHLGKL